MSRKNVTKTTGVLFLPDVPGLETNDKVTELWRTVLLGFVAVTCDGFGLSRVDASEALRRFVCLSDLQLSKRGRATCRTEWDTPAAGRRVVEDRFAVFELGAKAVERIANPMFHEWSMTSESFPADQLFFLALNEVILQVEPLEESMMFCNLTRNQCDQLHAVEPRALRYLNQSRNWIVDTQVE